MNENELNQFINGKENAEDSTEFLSQLQNNKEKHREEIIKKYESNRQQAEGQIKIAKSMLETLEWENGLVVGTIVEQPNYFAKILKWNENMLNLFN